MERPIPEANPEEKPLCGQRLDMIDQTRALFGPVEGCFGQPALFSAGPAYQVPLDKQPLTIKANKVMSSTYIEVTWTKIEY